MLEAKLAELCGAQMSFEYYFMRSEDWRGNDLKRDPTWGPEKPKLLRGVDVSYNTP